MLSRNHVFERDEFFRLLDLEIKRARRYQNFFSVMRFALHENGARATTVRAKSLNSLVKLLKGEIRETDVLGHTKKNEIMIILPYCDSSGADIVDSRLNSLIKEFRLGKDEFKIIFRLVCFPTEGTDMAEILKNLEGRIINARKRWRKDSKAPRVKQ